MCLRSTVVGLALMAGLVPLCHAGETAPAGLALRGPDGRRVALNAPTGGVTALVFLSTECPISNAYSPTLNAIAKEFPADRFRLVGIYVDPDLTDGQAASHADEYRLAFPMAIDRRGAVARALGVTVTPEAVLIDDAGAIRYRGRIDDMFAARGKKNANGETKELRDAVAAVLGSAKAVVPNVASVGCPLPEPAVPTYAGEVAAILQKNCQECHRSGQVGPFELLTYDQARRRADDLAQVAEDRRMPPWLAAPGYGPGFAHDRSLTTDEIATLRAWADAGAPEGDRAKLPPPRTFESDWKLGKPDMVLEIPMDYEIPAEVRDAQGKPADIYRCFVIPTDLPEDMYISGIEYRPGNARVVHHILGYVDTTGRARKLDAEEDGPGYNCYGGPRFDVTNDLSGWAPGADPSFLPDGIGRKLPKGGDVVLQVHYHPTGKPETDRTRIGLHFARKPIRQTLHWGAVIKPDFVLKPETANQAVDAYPWIVPVDLQAIVVSPHMHVRGKKMEVWAILPDKTRQDLIKIDDWDFQWQIQYEFDKAVDLPKGTQVHMKAVFDNSADNPLNPDPKQTVKWGEATTDEMCIGFVAVVKKGQDLTKPGEKDDLQKLFHEQENELREEMRKRQKEKPKTGE